MPFIKQSAHIYQDDQGRWWYKAPSSHRTKAFEKVCVECGEHFVACHKQRRFCGAKCSARHDRNTERFPKKDKHYNWQGGRMDHRGYILVHAPDHPVCQGNTRKYVLEHRLVMEAHLGRYLEPYESVHHINGRKDDNRLENLELWSKAHPYGVRAHEVPHCRTCTCGKH